jgi:hypothetical protein
LARKPEGVVYEYRAVQASGFALGKGVKLIVRSWPIFITSITGGMAIACAALA